MPIPETGDEADVGAEKFPVPEISDHVPTPTTGILPAIEAEEEQIV